MGINSQKTPFNRSLHTFGDIKSQDWLSRLPRTMPATITKVNGAIVTVQLTGKWTPYNIPQITIPQNFSQWVQEPTQVGDKGYVVGIEYYVGGQSGLGGGQADLYPRANLTNCVFQPISQKAFNNPDPNQLLLQGKSGVRLQDNQAKSVFNLNASQFKYTIGNATLLVENGQITLTVGSMLVQVTASRVDLGGTGGTGVATEAGISAHVFAIL